MKRYYRIYNYSANVRIPKSEHHADKCYTADEVESLTLADAYHGDCFLHDDPVLLTADKEAARAVLESLISKANTTVGREYGTNCEILQVTGCGMEILDYNDELFGEPEDEYEILDRAESYGEEWHFAGTNEEELIMVTETKRIELRNWFAFAEKSWETEGDASPYTIDEALKVSRMWELLNIADDLSDEEYARLRAMPADQIDWSAVKDIKRQYNLTWIELRWIAKFERDGLNHLFDDFLADASVFYSGSWPDHADPVSTDVQ